MTFLEFMGYFFLILLILPWFTEHPRIKLYERYINWVNKKLR